MTEKANICFPSVPPRKSLQIPLPFPFLSASSVTFDILQVTANTSGTAILVAILLVHEWFTLDPHYIFIFSSVLQFSL